MSRLSRGRALETAYRATARLYNPETPEPTNIWCGLKDSLELTERFPVYTLKLRGRNPLIFEELQSYVNTLDVRSVEHNLEMSYLNKYNVFRNWYFPESLKRVSLAFPWFHPGPSVPASVKKNLKDWWSRYVPGDYRILSSLGVPCPNFDGSGGVCLLEDENGVRWDYVKKGPYWPSIQRGTLVWESMVVQNLPSDILASRIEDIWKLSIPAIENLALERPVIRKEGGLMGARWARSSPGNSYILGREFVNNIQEHPNWKSSLEYLGKASNVQYAALTRHRRDDWDVATHGDDWIAWCPECQRWHSGDWSKFDHSMSAQLIAASYQAWYDATVHFMTERERKLFYAMAYYAVKMRSIWLWDEFGESNLRIVKTLGHVRSGSGEFIMGVNNPLNNSVLKYLLRKVHKTLSALGIRYPCRKPKKFWFEFSKLARSEIGWVAKPEAQLTHPHGFIACRCVHTEKDHFSPRPGVTSVVRNWVNPATDPLERPNNTPEFMVVRMRDLNKTLAWAPGDLGDRMMSTLVDVAVDAGVEDPYGADFSDAELSRAIQKVVGRYSTRSYIES